MAGRHKTTPASFMSSVAGGRRQVGHNVMITNVIFYHIATEQPNNRQQNSFSMAPCLTRAEAPLLFALILQSFNTPIHADMMIPRQAPSSCFASLKSLNRCRRGEMLHTRAHGLFSSLNSANIYSSQSSVDTSRRRIRAITCDVTGTLVSFEGKIEDHYGNAARACGIDIPPTQASLIPTAFKKAYKETSKAHPCFGNSEISSKEWWRRCVRRSFALVGTSMTEPQQERVFQRVYSAFGGHAAYSAFPDAIPFLNWCRRRGIACGVISNADERYGDSILPMLDLREVLQFTTFSKNVGYEKPDGRIFEAAMREAEPWLCLGKNRSENAGDSSLEVEPLKPEEILHIGNDFQKDFVGAKEAGFHAVLLDRFDEIDVAAEWRANGATVFKDLIDVVEFIGREQFELGSTRECCCPDDDSEVCYYDV